jgi:tetratricopeptide (TPR) repeat protein
MAADLRLEAGRDAEARPLAGEAIDVMQAIGDDLLLGRALLVAARADHARVGYEETAAQLGQALETFERTGDHRQVGRVLLTRAYVWLEAGQLDAAESDAARCVALGEVLDHAIGQAMARVIQIFVAFDRGELERARELLEAAMETARDCGYQTLLAYCLAATASLSAQEGDDRRAALILGALDAAGGAMGAEGAAAIRLRVEALRGELGARLGTELASLLGEGERMTLEELAAAPAAGV